MISLRRLKLKYWIFLISPLIFIVYFFGLHIRVQEKNFHTDFSYPMEGDVTDLAETLKQGEIPSIPPVYNHDYRFYKTPTAKCLSQDQSHYEPLRVLYLVKSALENFAQRLAIRRTWGYEKRFSDVPIRTVFLLGSDPDNVVLQGRVEEEDNQYGDIVQGDFTDNYYNNSIKTMMGLRWGVEHCPKARFYMFVDDDYYVSTRNLLRFLRNPVDYPRYLQEDVISFDEEEHKNKYSRKNQGVSRHLNQLVDFDLPDDVRLYAGYVFDSRRPQRHLTSKWYVDFEEYPYHLWPPYVTAGAYVLSRDALVHMYYTSYFTKLFRFDDIYLGLIAKKADIQPFHSDEFHFYQKPYKVLDYKYVVASHGYSDPKEQTRVWTQQKQAGNA